MTETRFAVGRNGTVCWIKDARYTVLGLDEAVQYHKNGVKFSQAAEFVIEKIRRALNT